MRPVPTAPLFDDHGLFAGPAAEHAFGILLRNIEQRIDADGWDQPAHVYGVVNPVHTEQQLGVDADTLHQFLTDHPELRVDADPTGPDTPDGAGLYQTAFMVVDLGALNGHPADALWGHTLPDWVSAVVLAFEGWTAPPDVLAGETPDPHPDLAPSQRPDRVEVRGVHMITRSDAAFAVSRIRGHEPEPAHADAHAGGYVVDVLRRTLGLPTDPPPDNSMADYLGRLALNTAVGAVGSLTGDLADEPDRAPQMRAFQEQARARLAQLPPADRAAALTGVFTTTLAAAVAQIAWRVTNHGKGPAATIPTPDRKRVRALTTGTDRDPANLPPTLAAARACATVAFTDLVAVRHTHTFLPPQVKAHPGWADDGLLYSTLCRRQLPTQQTMLDDVRAIAGCPLTPGVALLHAAGWADLDEDPPDLEELPGQ